MSVINIINCKTKNAPNIYAFASFMFGKSIITSNIAIFEDLIS